MSRLRIPYPFSAGPLRGFTLVEVALVIGLLVLISFLAVPTIIREIRKESLPGSGRQLQSLIALTRANAAMDGKRYRIRFPRTDEQEESEWVRKLTAGRQPIVEREDDPINEPDVFNVVSTPWAVGQTLLGEVWCAEVRLGRPTVEQLKARRSAVRDRLEEKKEEIEAERPPLLIDVDGTTDWATFVLTEAPKGTKIDRLEDFPTIEVIFDGSTGQTWLQRPLFDEELDLFEEKGWPCVLGQDYLDLAVITEERVLELRDFEIVQ
jgi:type II secretory pathway pseudopilin PulG